MGRGKQLLYTVAAALAFSACASTKKPPKIPKKAPIVESVNKAPEKLTSKWEKYTCSFDSKKMEMTYSDSKESVVMKLDTELDPVTKEMSDNLNAKELVCTENYSVVVGDEYALVAIGPRSALKGFQSLGIIDEEYTMSNSYYLKLNLLVENEVKSFFVVGSTLVLVTDNEMCRIDLSTNDKQITKK